MPLIDRVLREPVPDDLRGWGIVETFMMPCTFFVGWVQRSDKMRLMSIAQRDPQFSPADTAANFREKT